MSERGGKEQNTVEKVALEKAKTAAESTVSENATTEFTARRQGVQEVPVPVMQPVQIVERPLGLLKTIIDKELVRSCVERSERALADEAIADSSTAERDCALGARQSTGLMAMECHDTMSRLDMEWSIRNFRVSLTSLATKLQST